MNVIVKEESVLNFNSEKSDKINNIYREKILSYFDQLNRYFWESLGNVFWILTVVAMQKNKEQAF